jgi:hypothetical protein
LSNDAANVWLLNSRLGGFLFYAAVFSSPHDMEEVYEKSSNRTVNHLYRYDAGRPGHGS